MHTYYKHTSMHIASCTLTYAYMQCTHPCTLTRVHWHMHTHTNITYVNTYSIYIHTHTLDICILTHTLDICIYIMCILQTYILIWAIHILNTKIPWNYTYINTLQITYIHIRTCTCTYIYSFIHCYIYIRTYAYNVTHINFTNIDPYTYIHTLYTCIHIHTLHMYITYTYIHTLHMYIDIITYAHTHTWSYTL